MHCLEIRKNWGGYSGHDNAESMHTYTWKKPVSRRHWLTNNFHYTIIICTVWKEERTREGTSKHENAEIMQTYIWKKPDSRRHWLTNNISSNLEKDKSWMWCLSVTYLNVLSFETILSVLPLSEGLQLKWTYESR